ncbi:M24 family metallopeptidase [Aureibacter tunicatorum]|uniref:Xaa-Pro dipeptidase n=1 Tax=Aureibacter tunicatorum TaxID=866807 RepID=A0AAE3XIB1_9BACT|nr:Xaa-Pro peptidase family protein [Aureibacter tunicatorum]MDR6237332.1 Xaa-Pro dipeptidase [Aureibacter tunicatorum]BDD06323.1 metallopeptidase [Aureibacter tunicatorum]
MRTIGLGGSTIQEELDKFTNKAADITPIQKPEYEARIAKACELMKAEGLNAVYLNAGTNLHYFTGTKWGASERMVGAILTQSGKLTYIAPTFELGTINDMMLIEAPVRGWEEDESPYQLALDILAEEGIADGKIGLDESSAFFITDGLAQINKTYTFVNAKSITAGCRMYKSEAEISIMKALMDITMDVHKAVARILKPGIAAQEVIDFIEEAHIRSGIPTGSYFCIVLFGLDSSFPHGVKAPKNLEDNEIVLVDTGCQLHGYISDITRTYVYGEISDEHRRIWNLEKSTQLAAFEAAKLGDPCANVDLASRKNLEASGLGPDYKLPGLPHRTGHGIGMDIHEWPYMVRSEQTPMAPGMCFSIEPMIVVPDEFGVRLEDHVYMTEEGPKWFTEPAHSIEDPFNTQGN